jgi:hypothetical protein
MHNSKKETSDSNKTCTLRKLLRQREHRRFAFLLRNWMGWKRPSFVQGENTACTSQASGPLKCINSKMKCQIRIKIACLESCCEVGNADALSSYFKTESIESDLHLYKERMRGVYWPFQNASPKKKMSDLNKTCMFGKLLRCREHRCPEFLLRIWIDWKLPSFVRGEKTTCSSGPYKMHNSKRHCQIRIKLACLESSYDVGNTDASSSCCETETI